MTVLGPFTRQDTLFGRSARDTLIVPFRQLGRLERERFSVVRTTAVILAIPTALVVVYVIKCGQHRCGPSPAL